MKKTRKGRTEWAAALIVCVTVLFTTCKNNIGLGGTVDINPPTLNVLTIYPPAEAVIRDEFTLSIEATDDSGIASVNVQLIKAGLTEQPDGKVTAFDLIKAADGVHWTAQVNKKDEEKGYPLTDGAYKVRLTATDTAGKTARTESTVTIDNTAPLLILNRPSTTSLDDSGDMFGDGFLLVGQVYDKTTVASLGITATGEDGKTCTKVLSNVPQNIRITVDSFSSDEKEKQFYCGLYGDERNAGKKSYTYTIAVTDSAKEYKNPGDKGSGVGNTTNRYYLFNDLYDKVLQHYAIHDVYAMRLGTYMGGGGTRSAAEISRDVLSVLDDPAIMLGASDERKGTFRLYPSLNPRFDIAGEVPVAKPESGEPAFSRLYSGSTLTVKVSCNLDERPLEDAGRYRFFLMEWEDFLKYRGALSYPTDKINGTGERSIYEDAAETILKPELRGKLIEIKRNKEFDKEGSNYIFSVPVSAELLGLQYKKCYVLLVRGRDKENNELIPDTKNVTGGVYGFKITKTGKAPEVLLTGINDTVGSGEDGNITERVYLKKGNSLKFKMKLKYVAADVTYKVIKNADGSTVEEATEKYPIGEHEVTVDAAKFNQEADGTYKLTVKAEAEEGESLEQTYTIIYDVKGPEVRISFPMEGTLLNEEEGKALVIQGSAFDAGSGLDAPVTVTLTAMDGGSAPAVTLTENGENWKSQPINLPEGKYTLTVTAKDTLGQQTSESITFTYDKADPVISDLKVNIGLPNDKEVKGDEPVYTNTRSITIKGKVTESYGIDTFTINGTNAGTSSGPFEQPVTIANTEGEQTVTIEIKDKAGRGSPRTIKVILDKTDPVFENIKFANVDASGTLITTSENPVKITGTVKDSVLGRKVSGVEAVYYAVTASTANAPANTSDDWKRLNGKFDNDGFDYILTGFAEINSNDEQKIHIRAVDNAGNEKVFSHKVKVVPAAVIRWTLELENNSPSGTVKYNAGTWYAKGQFKVKIGGTLNSAPHGGSAMTVEITKKGTPDTPVDLIGTPTSFFASKAGPELKIYPTDKPTEYTVKSGQTEGEYTIKISAQGQAKLLTFTIDGTAPTITPASSGDGVLPADNKWVNKNALYVEGTAADATSGIEKIEAIVNSGTPKLISTDSPWSGYLTLNEGDNTVQFKVTDKAGNTASEPTPPRTIKVDTKLPNQPMITKIYLGTDDTKGKDPTPALTVSDNDDIKIKVTVSDQGASGIKDVKWKLAEASGVASLNSNIWELTIPKDKVKEGSVIITATDNAGNTSDSVRVTIQKDNAPPTITFDSPQNSQIVNKTITIKGTASDNNGLQSVKIVKSDGTELVGVSASSGAVSGDSETAANKALFKGVKAYNWQFDLDTMQYSNGELKLKAIATDAAGNTTEETLTLTVDQDSDRPQIVIANLNDLTEASGILKQSKEIRGFIKDDDGEISQIKINEAGQGESTVTVEGGSWSYTLKGSDGIKTLNFEVTDKAGTPFKTSETDALKQPRIYAGSISGSGHGTAVKFKMDTTAPISDGLSITDSSDGHEKAVERSLFLQTGQNGTYANAKFIVKAKDANNISEVKINIKQEGSVKDSVSAVIHAPINPSSNEVETWETAGKNLKDLNLKDGTVEFEIELTDKSGLKSVTSYTAFIDNTAPDLEVLSPSSAGNISGDVTMTGSITDGGSGVTGLKYIRGKQASEPTLSSVWTDVEASSGTWKIDFSGANSITSSHNMAQLGDVLPESGGKLYKVPVYFLTLDKVNNSHIIKKEFKVDPYGDIPEVTILSPAADSVLGGTIRIAGTVSVPKPEIGKVGSMYIQITNKTVGNPAKPDFSGSVVFGTENWCPSGGKPLTYIEGSPYWSLQINEHHEFESATSDDQVIWFRLCGKNNQTTPVAGQWTEPVKIIVNKKAPTITGVKVSTQAKFDAPLPDGSPAHPLESDNKAYVANMYIKGDDLYLCADLAHTAGIEKIDISGNYVGSSTITLTGDSEITSSNINGSGKAWFTPSSVPSSTSAKNYKMRIPLKTTTNPGSNSGFTIKVVITAKKAGGDVQELTAQRSWELKYDNSKPTAVFGTKIASSGTVQVSGSSFTDPALIGKTNINTSMKVFASGEAIKITNFDKDTGTVTLYSAPTQPTKGYLIYAPIEYLRPTSGKVGVFGAAYDVGAGVEKIKVKYKVKDGETPEVALEFPIGIQKDVGSGDVNFVTWSGELNTSALIDGKGTLTITPIDAAGNAPSPIEVEVKHKKNSLAINKVFLGTDLNRNGSIEESTATQTLETAALTIGYAPLHPDGIDSTRYYDWYGKSDGGTFRFKNNKSHIKIETVGGSGTKKYTLKCTTNGNDIRSLTELPAGGIIELTTADFTKIGQSTNFDADPTKRVLVLTVWDSAHGLICGTDTWKAELTLDVIVDTNDRIAPTNKIDPFKWASESENSLYGNSRDNGHIEIGTDLPSAFTDGGTGVMDRDDKVSGKISITGTANDDQVITEIWAKIDGFKFDGITGAAESTETKLTEYNPTTGKFKDVGAGTDVYDPNYRPSVPKPESTAPVEEQNAYNEYTAYITKRNNFFAAKGWLLTIVNSEFSVEKGHTVKWRLDWDSSKINGGVGTNKTITITVKDTAPTNTVSDNRKVDVVPYITGVTRNSTYNTKRARSGAIPLLRGEKSNTLTGFNFTTAGSTSLKITANKDGGGSALEMEQLTLNGKDFTFDVPDTAKDGYLHLVVNGVAAVNNTNAYTESNMEKSDTYGTAKHSDDRLVHIWRVNKEDTFKGSKNAIYPAMSKGTGGTLYASFSNYSKSEVYYSNAFTGDPDPNHSPEVGGSGTTTLFTGYDPPEETDITVNGTEVNVLYAANYHGGTVAQWGQGSPYNPYGFWNDTAASKAGGIYLYDKDAPSIYVNPNGTSTETQEAKIYRFELFTYDNELQQFKNIRTLRAGNNIYVVYYDRLTGAVKFAWVDDSKTPDTKLKALPWCVIDGNTDVTDRDAKVPDAPDSAPSNQKTFTFVSPNGSTYASPYVLNGFDDELSVSHTVWESVAVATTTQGYPVVVYMDSATGGLRLARGKKIQPTAPTDWTIQKVLASSDPNGKIASDYINACIGTDGVLHIAFQNTRGQLVYVKSTNTSNNGSTKYTFEKSEVLDDSGMSIDMTINGTIPYITYVSRPNSYDAIRIAYKTSMDFDNTGTNVEGWETMTAPLNERATNSRICIETQAKHYNATGTMPVAVGFKTNSDYRAAFYVGK